MERYTKSNVLNEESVQARLLGEPTFCYQETWLTLSFGKTSALLYYLAYQSAWVSRDDVLYLIWPDIEEKKARNNLRYMLSANRKLPHLRTLESENNRLRWLVQSDVHDFRAAVSEKHWSEVVRLYQGVLLQGVVADRIPEFASWLALERASLHKTYCDAVFKCTAELEAQGRYLQGAELLKTLHETDPFNEEVFRRYLELLALSGQRREAEKAYHLFEQSLKAEFGGEPENATLQLVTHLRQGKIFSNEHIQIRPYDAANPSLKKQSNLPINTTTFIGRTRELKEVIESLNHASCRLLTIVAAGGMGKTRLALEAGKELAKQFVDGVYFIPFDTVPSSDLVVPALADALNFSFFGRQAPKDQLLSYLETKNMLLIMDNLEHIPGSTTLIATLFKQAPELSFLCTSREPLNLQAEWLYDLSGMQLPLATGDFDNAQDSDAVKLFLQAGRKTKADFMIDASNLKSIVQICHLVEGMPLALELAASWLRVLSAPEISAELEKDLSSLKSKWQDAPKRHQSMQAVFDSSWQRLSKSEKLALQKVAIFQGSFSKKAAREVADTGLPLILLLTNKSLLRKTALGRFSQHPLMWQQTRTEAERSCDSFEKIAEKHASYFAAFLQEREAGHESLEASRVRGEIALELANVRAAWYWAIEHGREDLIDVALWSLFEFYKGEGRFQEGKDLFSYAEKTIARDSLVRARLLHKLGIFHNLHGTFAEGERLLELSLSISKQHKSKEDIAHALFVLNNNYNASGKKSYTYRKTKCREYLALFKEVGNHFFVARSLWHLTSFTKDPEENEALHQEAIRLFRQTESYFGLSAVLMTYAKDVLERHGAYEQANTLINEAFSIEKRRGIPFRLVWLYSSRGFILMAQGKYQEAETHLKEAVHIQKQFDIRYFGATALQTLGRLSRLQHDYENAQLYLQAALEQGKKPEDTLSIAITTTELGQLAFAEQDYSRAVELCTQALEHLSDKTHDESWHYVLCLKTLADAALALNDDKQTSKHLDKALKVAKIWRLKPLQLMLLSSYADLHLYRENKQGATRLLDFVVNHPASMFETKTLAQEKLELNDFNKVIDGELLELEDITEDLLRKA